MVNILDKLRSMIAMQGGDVRGIDRIDVAVVVLEKLLKEKNNDFRAVHTEPRQNFERRERKEHTEYRKQS